MFSLLDMLNDYFVTDKFFKTNGRLEEQSDVTYIIIVLDLMQTPCGRVGVGRGSVTMIMLSLA